MPALDLIRPSVTAMRVIASVNAEFARELKLPPHIRSPVSYTHLGLSLDNRAGVIGLVEARPGITHQPVSYTHLVVHTWPHHWWLWPD